MKRLVVKIISFSIPAFLFFISTLTFYYVSKQKTNSKLKNLSQYQCLLMGDSQIQRLRGDIISKSAKNIASSGEHYYFTYHKLLTILQNENRKLNKIILGVSIHNFAPVYNRLFNIEFSEGKNSLKRYLYFIQIFSDSNFLTDYTQLIKPSIVSSVFSSAEWGGFKESNNSNPSEEIIDKSFNIHFSIKGNEEEFSYSQRKYLHKIDSLCSLNKIELIFVSTPYHQRYKDKIDAKYLNFFSETLKNFNHRYHINFIADKVDPSIMSDANHLNKLGAKKYSGIIETNINARMRNNVFKK